MVTGLMTRVNLTDAVVPAVAVMVTAKLPDAVGVPLIVPVAGFSPRYCRILQLVGVVDWQVAIPAAKVGA